MAEKGNDDPPPGGEAPELDPIEPAQDNPEESSAQAARRLTSELRLQTFSFSGPLPPPEVLKGYNEVFAGCAERIVAMTERQSAHRQEIEKTVIESNCKAQSRGQWFAFVLALVVISGGVYLLAQGKSLQGFSAIILAVASLMGALIYGHTEQRKEREQKSRELPQAPNPRQSSN